MKGWLNRQAKRTKLMREFLIDESDKHWQLVTPWLSPKTIEIDGEHRGRAQRVPVRVLTHLRRTAGRVTLRAMLGKPGCPVVYDPVPVRGSLTYMATPAGRAIGPRGRLWR